MTNIDVKCRLCGAVYHADETHVGKAIRCTRCGSIISITTGAASPVPVGSPSTPRRSPAASQPTVQPATARGKHDRPRVWTAVIVIAAVGSIAAAWAAFMGLHANSNGTGREEHPAVAMRSADTSTPPAQSQAAPEPDKLAPPAPVVIRPPARPPHSLPTGTKIAEDSGGEGNGLLSINNGTRHDAVIRLYTTVTNETIRWRYIPRGESLKLGGIPVGDYQFAFCHWAGLG